MLCCIFCVFSLLFLASDVMQSSVPRELTRYGTSGESLGCRSRPENEFCFCFSETVEHYYPLLSLVAPVPRCLIPVHQQLVKTNKCH